MWFRKKAIPADEERIEELLTRGVAALYPSREFLTERLRSGKRLTLYLGVDPTGPSLHLGHLIPLRKLQAFQELGHQAILLIGDFTGMIGDPTDKSATRTRLTHAEVLANAARYKEQASHFLSFSGSNPAEIRYNASWNSKLSFEGVLDLAAHFTVQQMIERDMFEKRMEEGKPIYLHEFLYPLIQGYDSVAMEVDGELGGSDQTFNMLAGRTLMKQMKGKEKFVLSTRLLEDPSGKKMGKTEGNMVTLADTPEDIVGKIMSWDDAMIAPGFELLTSIARAELSRIVAGIASGDNPRDAKLRLAGMIATDLYGAARAGRAVESFIVTFSDRGVPKEMPEVTVRSGTTLADILVPNQVASKSELRRLLSAGAIETSEGKTFDRVDEALTEDVVIRVGKKRFLKVRIT